jgi:hypothetical protein
MQAFEGCEIGGIAPDIVKTSTMLFEPAQYPQ